MIFKKEKLNASSAQNDANPHTFPVEVAKHAPVSLIGTDSIEPHEFADSAAAFQALSTFTRSQNGFFGLDDEIHQENEQGNMIEAVIHDTQEVVAGSTVRMGLLSEIRINGKLIPKDQFILGTRIRLWKKVRLSTSPRMPALLPRKRIIC